MDEVDLVFVDGPPQSEGDEMSRLKVCNWAMMRHGVFLRHDAKRESEKKILRTFRDQGADVLEISGRQEGERVEVFEGESVEVLSWMIANEGYWESEGHLEKLLVEVLEFAEEPAGAFCDSPEGAGDAVAFDRELKGGVGHFRLH